MTISEELPYLRSSELFDLSRSFAGEYLRQVIWPWEALSLIKQYILMIAEGLPADEYEQIGENIWVARDSVISPTASLNGPLIIGHEAEVRHCAFIRGSALVGNSCVIGNSTELKNCILFDAVQVPHFNYVGDSILGYKAHLGAGAITSNVKGDHGEISLNLGGRRVATGLRKFGALLGDFVEVGCNSVLNPGSIIGRNSQIYPLSMVRGYIPVNSIYKTSGEIIVRRKPEDN